MHSDWPEDIPNQTHLEQVPQYLSILKLFTYLFIYVCLFVCLCLFIDLLNLFILCLKLT